MCRSLNIWPHTARNPRLRLHEVQWMRRPRLSVTVGCLSEGAAHPEHAEEGLLKIVALA
jgi:hypothetical protein